MDPSTRPQLTLSSRKHFIDEVARQTASGFGPDLVITDSETALGLYQRKLLDPITLKTEDKQDIPQALLNLATAKDGQLVGRPVNCTKERKKMRDQPCSTTDQVQIPTVLDFPIHGIAALAGRGPIELRATNRLLSASRSRESQEDSAG